MGIALFISHKSLFHENRIDDYLDCLNQDEIKRYQQLSNHSDKQGYVLSSVLLKAALKKYAPSVLPRAWQFGTNRYGKPFILHPHIPQPLFFNLSHTTDAVAVAISPQSELGVDIEKMRDINGSQSTSYLDISKRFFTPQESRHIASLSLREGQLLFWKMWTLKEAYIKYRGKGLSLGLDCIAFDMTSTPIIAQHDGTGVYFCQWQMQDTLLALAFPQHRQKITLLSFPAQAAGHSSGYQLIHSSST